ncbi:solute carrier family 35 member F4-like isoform X2 [Paramacrobiotus metropolitanus]|uniref:solute carrier family 35 member F4-like isoform X2 n=1 Tax=Paramacrobiotus metropolitanus TaxID=2943436 RepID=UPI00244573E4|nr:solute carrier family 35 member F4-like isoform X2 [Paramacrobiotus metropolitanus]
MDNSEERIPTPENVDVIFTVEPLHNPVQECPVEVSQDAKTDAASHKQSASEWFLAVIMLAITVAASTAAGQLTNLALTDEKMNFHAPFLFVMFKILFRSMSFPLYLVINTIIKVIRGRKLDLRRTCRRGKDICGEDGLSVKTIFFKFFPPMVFSLLSQLTYTLALSNLSTSMASALTPPSVAISYILSWLFLKHRLLLIKILFVFVTFGGVALIAYHEFTVNLAKKTVVGLTFKKSFPKGHLGQVSFAITVMYALMAVVYWPIPLAMHLSGHENYDITMLPYPILTAAWSCTAISSLVYGYGIVLAGGFFMGLSDLIVLAVNSGIDVTLRGVLISNAQIMGTVIVSLAFVMLVLPDNIVSLNLKKWIGGLRQPKLKAEKWDSLSETGSVTSYDSFTLKRRSPVIPRIRTSTDELLKSYDVLEERDFMALSENTAVEPLTNS